MDRLEASKNQNTKKSNWVKKATGVALTAAAILAIWKLPAKWSEQQLKNI